MNITIPRVILPRQTLEESAAAIARAEKKLTAELNERQTAAEGEERFPLFTPLKESLDRSTAGAKNKCIALSMQLFFLQHIYAYGEALKDCRSLWREILANPLSQPGSVMPVIDGKRIQSIEGASLFFFYYPKLSSNRFLEPQERELLEEAATDCHHEASNLAKFFLGKLKFDSTRDRRVSLFGNISLASKQQSDYFENFEGAREKFLEVEALPIINNAREQFQQWIHTTGQKKLTHDYFLHDITDEALDNRQHNIRAWAKEMPAHREKYEALLKIIQQNAPKKNKLSYLAQHLRCLNWIHGQSEPLKVYLQHLEDFHASIFSLQPTIANQPPEEIVPPPREAPIQKRKTKSGKKTKKKKKNASASQKAEAPAVESMAAAPALPVQELTPSPAKRPAIAKKIVSLPFATKFEAVLKAPYHKRVKDWFTESPQQLHHPSYKNLTPEQMNRQRLYHAFSRKVDLFVEHYAFKAPWLNPTTGHTDLMFGIVGEIHMENKKSEAIEKIRGVFIYTISALDNKLYHRKFNPFPGEELLSYIEPTFRHIDYPPLGLPDVAKEKTTKAHPLTGGNDRVSIDRFNTIRINDVFHKAALYLFKPLPHERHLKSIPK